MTTVTTAAGLTFDICALCKHWTARHPAGCLCECHGEPITWEDEG